MNFFHESARAQWPGCTVTGSGPFALVVPRFFNPPLVFLYTTIDAAKAEQFQRGGQIQTIAPMKRPAPYDLGWE
jgi:hypothetical protein